MESELAEKGTDRENQPRRLDDDNLDMMMHYPLRLEAIDECGVSMSCATGFLFRSVGRLYLITNWHVVSGRNAFDGTFLNKDKRMPLTLLVTINSSLVVDKDDDYSPTIGYPFCLPLRREDDELGIVPTWREHPLGDIVDVVALDITDTDFQHSKLLVHALTPGYGNAPEGRYRSFTKPAHERDDIAIRRERLTHLSVSTPMS